MPLRESEIINAIRKRSKLRSQALRVGIGDDCAVIRPKRSEELVVTTDFSIEGTHFRRDWHPADSVGHRCLARGLSDIAAMGARPLAAFLSLGLPARLPQKWADDFLRGFLALAKQHGVPLAGGDTGESKSGIVADVTVVGAVPRGRAILRSGASPGDLICVTGSLGGSAAMLRRVYAKRPPYRSKNLSDKDGATAHFFPEPRLGVAAWLQKSRLATSMIDLSDGLSTDLSHICEESKVGAMLVTQLIPVAPNATLEDALHGGEDYELLFTAQS